MQGNLPLIILITCVSLSPMIAQTDMARIPAKNASGIQFFAAGDSLLLIYNEDAQGPKQRAATWVLPDGGTERVFIPMGDKTFLNVWKKRSNAYLYFIEEKKKVVSLGTIRMTDGKPSSERLAMNLVLKGSYVGSFSAKYFHVISFDVDTDEFNFYLIDGEEVKETHVVKFPGARDHIVDDRFEFIDGPTFSHGLNGAGTLKVVREAEILYISADDIRAEKTVIGTLTLNNFSYSSSVITHEEKNPLISFKGWTSFPSHGNLYVGYLSGQLIDLSVFDLSGGKLIHQSTVDVASAITKNSYVRDGRSSTLAAGKNFNPSGKATMLVTDDSGVTRVRFGSFYATGPSVPVLPGAYVVASFATQLIISATSNDEPNGVSRYVYFNESKDHTGVRVPAASADKSKSQLVDDYEADIKRRPRSKSYLKSGGQCISVYMYDDNLTVVRF